MADNLTAYLARLRRDYNGPLCEPVPSLVAALEAVLEHHRPDSGPVPHCIGCGMRSPCPDIQAITAALTRKEAGGEEKPAAPPDTDAFPLDIALGEGGESWCVLAEDGGRADCDSRGEAYGVAAGVAAAGGRAAVYVRSASRYCFARYEVVRPDAVKVPQQELSKEAGNAQT